MSGTELMMIIFTVCMLAVSVAVAVLYCRIKKLREHKQPTLFCIGFFMFAAIVMLSAALAVHYGLSAQLTASCVMLGASGALCVLALAIVFGIIPVGRRHKVPWLTAAVVFIVLSIQISVNIAYPYEFGSDKKEELSAGVLLARVISSTFQSFSLDAGYVEIIKTGAAELPLGASYLFYIIACAMTVIAPVVGGFAIFGVLGHFFPRIALWRNIQSTKYVFSELNEYSIETAESIAEIKSRLSADKRERAEYIRRYGKADYAEIMHSVIVFTDVYADKASESNAELLQRANNINAICLKDDILTRKIYWIAGALYRAVTHTKKKVVYFLMDRSDLSSENGAESNLRTAVSLFASDKKNMMFVKTHWWQFGMKADAMEMYVFSRNENADGIIKNARKGFLKALYTKADKNCEPPFLYKVLNEYRNLVYNLLDGNGAYPLYSRYGREPDGDGIKKLSVLIVGGGMIASEFLKTAYWCGQMTDGKMPTSLRMAVMSLDADKTEQKLAFDMPQVFGDGASKRDAADKYAYSPDDYCRFRFINAEYGTPEFVTEFRNVASGAIWAKDGDKLAPPAVPDVDYILVALGADNLNMQAASMLRRELALYGEQAVNKIPINFVIENDALCETLKMNEAKDGQKDGKKRDDGDERFFNAVLNPFGSLKERFSFGNITLSDIEQRAFAADNTHSNASRGKVTFLTDEYLRSSSVAAAIHIMYKQRCIDFSAADADRRLVQAEHRRWCAYTRSTGFRTHTATEFASLAVACDNDGNKRILGKNIKLKLHACLVECSDEPTSADDISRFLTADPQYKTRLTDVLSAIAENRGGMRKKTGDSLHGVFEYLRQKYKYTLDDLDMLSAAVSAPNDEFSYKTYDIDICKKLYMNLLNDRLRRGVAEMLKSGATDVVLCELGKSANAVELMRVGLGTDAYIACDAGGVDAILLCGCDGAKFDGIAVYAAPETAVEVNPEPRRKTSADKKDRRNGFAVSCGDCFVVALPHGKRTQFTLDGKMYVLSKKMTIDGARACVEVVEKNEKSDGDAV